MDHDQSVEPAGLKLKLKGVSTLFHPMSAQDLLIWKKRTKSFAEEIKEKAAVLQYVPPIEISLGVTVPGRQGYIDTCMQFEQMLWLCPKCYKPLVTDKCARCM